MTENIKIWEKILPELVKKIKEAENNSYSINLLEEVKMANKFVRETKKNEKKEVSLRVNVDENANSRILAKLFQYKSPDGKYEILQSLLNYICDKKDISDFGNIGIDNKPIITTEETLTEKTLTEETQNKDNGRIDILVRTGNYAIIFENKLFNAPDQEHQLAGYIEKVESVKGPNGDSKYKDDNIFVIYLSRDGIEPDDKSWKNPKIKESFANRYANLSFKDDILHWLEDYVLPNVRKKDTDLESALVQYINYLKRLFMMNNDDLTKWLEKELENGEEESNKPHMVKIHRLEKVEELLATLKKLLATLNRNEGENGEINVEIAKLIGFTKDNTNEDLLNKTIAVIENLRDNCRNKVLDPFYDASKVYFDIDLIHVSSPSAAYCWLLKNKKWEGEIRFIWNPFFFLDKKYRNKYYKYPLMLDIQHSSNEEKFNERINKLKAVFPNGVLAKVNELQKKYPKKMKLGDNSVVEISYESLSNDLDSIVNKKDNNMHPILRLLLKTDKKLLYFDPKDQETLFRAIYESLSEIINAIDAKYPQNPA